MIRDSQLEEGGTRISRALDNADLGSDFKVGEPKVIVAEKRTDEIQDGGDATPMSPSNALLSTRPAAGADSKKSG